VHSACVWLRVASSSLNLVYFRVRVTFRSSSLLARSSALRVFIWFLQLLCRDWLVATFPLSTKSDPATADDSWSSWAKLSFPISYLMTPSLRLSSFSRFFIWVLRKTFSLLDMFLSCLQVLISSCSYISLSRRPPPPPVRLVLNPEPAGVMTADIGLCGWGFICYLPPPAPTCPFYDCCIVE